MTMGHLQRHFFLPLRQNLMFAIFVLLAALLSSRNMITLAMGKYLLTNALLKVFAVYLFVFLWTLQDGFSMFLMHIALICPWM